MLTLKRSLALAALALTILFLLTRSHSAPSIALGSASVPSNKATTADGPVKAGIEPAVAYTTSTSPQGAGKRPAKQRPIADLSSMTLLDKLTYQFPYDLETKFPAYIWQTWKTTPGSGNFEEMFRPAEASWSEKHPGFIHEVITDQVAVHLIRHLYASVPEILEAYAALPLNIYRADFFRYLILLARGGIYSDIDTHALKSALEWLPESVPREAVGLIVGIEADPDRPDWAQWYSRRIQFCQWTIQAKSGHPVLREIVMRITQKTLEMKKDGTLGQLKKDDQVVEFSGPAIWTDIIFDFFNNPKYFDMSQNAGNITWKEFTGMKSPKKVGDVVVLPITSFSPGVQQMGAEDYDHPMAFVKHEFEGTWKPDKLRHIGQTTEQKEEEEKKAHPAA